MVSIYTLYNVRETVEFTRSKYSSSNIEIDSNHRAFTLVAFLL